MSLLLVIGDDELTAYSLVKKPVEHESPPDKDPRLIDTFSLVTDALKIRELIHSTESGRFWYEHKDFFDPTERVDYVLLSNLLEAFRQIKGELGGDGAQALLMQTMFIAYLEDRKIINSDVFRKASGDAFSTFGELLEAETPTAFENLFIWLNEKFNGNVFNAPCAFELGNTEAPEIKTHHLRVLARFRHGHEEMKSGQGRFWGYDFQYIPIALISAVYDRFLKEESDRKNAEGAFYTPMFLADMVVNQLWDKLTDQQRASGTFYDPACGSGIFLVRIFQRLVAHHCRTKNKVRASWKELMSIARRLHGGDINTSAVRVAAFSLYIALLEHSDPPDLQALINKGKLLPVLYGDTLRPGEDFFSTLDESRYDAIVGNPPWKGCSGQITTAQKWTKAQQLPDPAKDIVWGFVWKALNVLNPGGFIGYLLPAMGVLHNTSPKALNARRLLLQRSRVRRVINLSDLCFQLFDGAKRPTTFVLYQHADNGDTPYRFEYWTPKADLNLRLKRLLTLARSDRTQIRSDHVEQDPSIFKRRFWTRSPDEKLLQYLGGIPPLDIFIKQSKPLRGKYDRSTVWAIGQGFEPAQSNRIEDETYKTKSAPIVTQYPYLDINSFRPLALPKIRAKPWPNALMYRTGFEDCFIGPHIIIPQGVKRSTGRVRAAYTEQDLVFKCSLQAIIFPPEERVTAKLLTAILNSQLAAWFYFHETANLGTDRAKVLQKDLMKLPFATVEHMPDPKRAAASARKIVQVVDREIKRANDILQRQDDVLKEIDALVYDYYGLDAHDVALIEDSFKYIIPAMQPRSSAGLQAIWHRSRIEHRSAYTAMLCDALKPWLNKPIKASLAAMSTDIAVLKLTLDKNQVDHAYKEESAPEVEPFLQKMSANLPDRLPGNFQLVPDLRFVIGQDMYLVKPMQLRHWLQSAALADAEQIVAELSANLARMPKRDVHNARR